jgi:death-on-curing protein
VERIEFGDFLLIAEAVTGIDARALARMPRVVAEAQAALAAPFAGFGEVEVFEPFQAKAAVYCTRIVRHHPLPDGNKRVGWLVMREFIARNGWTWVAGGDERHAAWVEGLAAASIGERRFIEWAWDQMIPPS